jgi:hypothetical protein
MQLGNITIPDFRYKKDMFDFLVTNKETIKAQKKELKVEANGIPYTLGTGLPIIKTEGTEKAMPVEIKMDEEYKVKAIINTTNVIDSHLDAHFPGIWTKTLQEKRIMHIREHKSRDFEYIISEGEDLNAFVKTYNWGELGFPQFTGNTEALVFDSTIKRAGMAARNPFMFDQYRKGYVKQHSVAMRYIRLKMAINDPDYKEEFSTWQTYYPLLANNDMADKTGFFWAVTEASASEGSAVPLGSNPFTPTQNINLKFKNEVAPQKTSTQLQIEYYKRQSAAFSTL